MCLPCQQTGQVECWKSPLYVNIACIEIDHGLCYNRELRVLRTQTRLAHLQSKFFLSFVVIATQPCFYDLQRQFPFAGKGSLLMYREQEAFLITFI